ncbi:MAG: putative spermidine/putrescine transport system substrate-binding protein [Glomeribacter sp. 1016415]|nr:putative spermidine/putrescine transport system substrate-binding protein [Glomeribacter sp. 1016415]
MNDKNKPKAGRRKIVKNLALCTAASLCIPFILTPSKAASKQRIVIRDLGGEIHEGYKKVLYKPFAQKTGIQVVGVQAIANPTAQIQAMVQSENLLWDMAALSEMAILILTNGTGDKCFLEKHQLEGDPTISRIAPQFIFPYGVGTNVYSTVLAYRTDVFKKAGEVPQTWQDLWNTKRFPCRRGLYRHPLDTAEVALMADGVSAEKVYPCDLERMFRSLDKIKQHIRIWWTSGTQVEQLLKSKEIDLVPAWISRVQAAINAGVPIAFSWEQHIYECNSWAILKGTRNANACREFIKFASDPERQARLAEYGVGPTLPEAFNYIKPERAKQLTSYPENLKKGLHTDSIYWLNNQDRAIREFTEWLAKP